ncbi:site-specific integrase [Myxococcus sp. 1LA]
MAPTKKAKKLKPGDASAQRALELGATPTLPELVSWYGATVLQHMKPDTQKTVRSHLALAVAALPSRPVGGDIAEWLSGRVAAGEVMPSTANQVRKHLFRIYTVGQQLRWPLLLNAVANVSRIPEPPLAPRGLADPYTTFPALLVAMPDARARAFLSVQRRHGLRMSEALGLEPRHINWSTGKLRVEHQRAPWRSTVSPLKHDTLAATFDMDEETARLLREAARDAMRSGAVPRGEAKRRFLFPYYQEHCAPLMARCREVAPDDFPERIVGERGGNAWHVFRHTYGTELANAGLPDREIMVLMRHKNLSSTELYVGSIRGRVMPGAALAKVRELAKEREREAAERLSRGVTKPEAGNTTAGTFGQ